ncbi:formyl-coenzyme A transferase [compost metagenome]
MLESLVEWMNYPLYYAFEGAAPPPRAGAAHATIYPYGPFPIGDGSTVMLGLQNEREWHLFCEQVLLQPSLADDDRFSANFKRVENRDALRALIVEAFASLDFNTVIQRLDVASIANARVNDMQGVWQHPQLKARDRWRHIDTAGGSIPSLLPPATSNAYSPRMDAVPALGQHSESILVELGLPSERIQQLRTSGVI